MVYHGLYNGHDHIQIHITSHNIPFMVVRHTQGLTEFRPWRTSREGVETSASRREARCGLWMRNIKNSRGHQPSKPAMKLNLEEFFKNDEWFGYEAWWILRAMMLIDSPSWSPLDDCRNRKCFLDKLLYQVVVICHQINGYSLNMLSAAQIQVCRWTRNHQNEC